jgi:hypothetical protein
MSETGMAGPAPVSHRKHGRRKLVLAVVISCVIVAGIASGTYLLMPRTVHFYAMNDNPEPLNVTVEVDGALIIRGQVAAVSNGVVGVIEKDASLAGVLHSLKCDAKALDLSASQTFNTYGGLYVLVDFSPGSITVQFIDHAPLFM